MKVAGMHDPACSALKPMDGPILSWGEPSGVYSLEIVPGGAYFRHGHASIYLDTAALAEMKQLVSMLQFSFKTEVPDGKITVN